ncbi:MAG: hypothetical protein HY678_12580 [Chloroflexi bacterium]|nr:hypothetical protein [Chloroflexota bacterium]
MLLRMVTALLKRRDRHKRTSISEQRWRIPRGRPESLADRLPWFGMNPFEPSRGKIVPRDAVNDVPFARRVMLSWLIGRPVSAVASRAFCSSRLVYDVLRHNVYAEDPGRGLERALKLGLVIVPGVPAPPRPGQREDPRHRDQSEYWVPVFCGVCHRLLGRYEVPRDRPNLVLLTARDLGWNLSERTGWGGEIYKIAIPVQAHLINHFRLSRDPIRIPAELPWGVLEPFLDNPKVAQAAVRKSQAREAILRRMPWKNRLRSEVVREANRTRGWSLLPREEGREVGSREAESMWRQALAGPDPETPRRDCDNHERRGRAPKPR